jgi:uncharacterized protein (UPF0218 family)
MIMRQSNRQGLGQTEASLSDSDESKTSSSARDKIITVGDVKQQ